MFEVGIHDKTYYVGCDNVLNFIGMYEIYLLYANIT